MLPSIKLYFERWAWNSQYKVWVSTEGRIKNEYKQIIEPMVDDRGYLTFFDEVTQTFHRVHRVVLETWRPRNDMRQLTVEHKDQNKRNPALKNLMWLTAEENKRRGGFHFLGPKAIGTANKLICANGVVMTVEEAITFIFNNSSLNGHLSKIDVRTKVNAALSSDKQKKCAFGVTFTEVES